MGGESNADTGELRAEISTKELKGVPETVLQTRERVPFTAVERVAINQATQEAMAVIMNTRYSELPQVDNLPPYLFNNPDFWREYIRTRDSQRQLYTFFSRTAEFPAEVADMSIIQALDQASRAAELMGVAREVAVNYVQDKKRNLIDPLTQLRGPNYAKTVLEGQVNDEIAGGSEVVIIMADVDYMKRYNDGYGDHDETDRRVIKPIAKVLARIFRTEDIVVRRSGDEFIIVMKGVSAQDAQTAVKRVQQALITYNIPGAPAYEDQPAQPHCSMSFGIVKAEAGDQYQQLISKADRAMYVGKRGEHGEKARGNAIIYDDWMKDVEEKPLDR